MKERRREGGAIFLTGWMKKNRAGLAERRDEKRGKAIKMVTRL